MSFIKKHSFPLILILIAVVLGFILFSYGSEIASTAFPSNPNRNGELLKVALSVFGGLFVLYGLYVSFLRARAAERAVEAQTLAIANQSNEIELSRESLTNEQFKTAIEHLGSEKEPVILGGVAELNEIAEKFSEKYAHVIHDIFCSYVRSEASRRKETPEIKWSVINLITKNLLKNSSFKGLEADLRYSNLTLVEISNCEIKSWNFSNSKLPVSILKVAFEDCSFIGASLHNPSYNDVTFDNCSFLNFFIEDGYFSACRFIGASYIQVSAIDVLFTSIKIEATLGKSKFLACHFIGCDLGEESLFNIDFSGSGFYGMKFKSYIFQCNFSAAAFQEVEFETSGQYCQFDGIFSRPEASANNLQNRLLSCIGRYADTSGIVFHEEFEGRADSQLSEKDAQSIAEEYNLLISEKSTIPDKKISLSLITLS